MNKQAPAYLPQCCCICFCPRMFWSYLTFALPNRFQIL